MTAFELDLTSAPTGIYSLSYADAPTVVYNETLKSLDISSSTTNHKVVMPGGKVGVTSDQYIVETDIELISDISGRRVVGIALIDPLSVSGGYFSGPEACSLDSGWRSMHRNAWMSNDIIYVSLANSSVNYTVGARHVLKFVRSGLHYDFYVDGSLVFSFDDTVVRETSLLPGIIVYQCAIRVRTFKYSATLLDDVAVAKACPDVTIFSGDRSRESLYCGDLSIKQIPTQQCRGIRMLSGAIESIPSTSIYGYIEGKITRRGDVAPAHIVACFDSGFNLIDTVKSGYAGEYRFDNLPLQDSYMIVAMDNSTYTYNPAAADRRTPRAYS